MVTYIIEQHMVTHIFQIMPQVFHFCPIVMSVKNYLLMMMWKWHGMPCQLCDMEFLLYRGCIDSIETLMYKLAQIKHRGP